MTLREILKDQYLCMRYKDVPKISDVNLLDDLKRWLLDERTYEMVFERVGMDAIRIYHLAELNMFTNANLIMITTTSPFGKREWNAYIMEMIVNVSENLIKQFPKEPEHDVQTRKEKEKEKAKGRKKSVPRKKESGQRAGGISIDD